MTARAAILAVSVSMLAAGCSPEQPLPGCVIGHGAYTARYVLVSGTGVCASKGVETWDLQKYIQPSDKKPVTPESAPPPDFEKAIIYLSTGEISTESANDPAAVAYGIGNMNEGGPKDGYCGVPTLSAATVNTGTLALNYEFSDLRIYQAKGLFGTQLSANLRYTRDGCTAEYKAIAMFPSVSCANADTGLPDESMCVASATNGIDPKFDTTCDTASMMCVLTKEPLSVK